MQNIFHERMILFINIVKIMHFKKLLSHIKSLWSHLHLYIELRLVGLVIEKGLSSAIAPMRCASIGKSSTKRGFIWPFNIEFVIPITLILQFYSYQLTTRLFLIFLTYNFDFCKHLMFLTYNFKFLTYNFNFCNT